MASQFKNRLVGVTILVACVVIFLPTIIDGKKNSYVEEFTATPISPELKQHTSVNTNPDIDNPPSDSTNSQSDIDSPDSYLSAVSGDAASAQTSATNNSDDEWEIEEVANTVSISKQPEEIEDQEKVAKVEAVQKPQKVQTVQKVQQVQQTAKVAPIPLPDNAWIIQIGAFQNAANIKALLKQLHTAGFQAHSVPAEIRDGVLTRVFVGPDVSEARLKEQLPRLKKLTNLDGKILPFKATNP